MSFGRTQSLADQIAAYVADTVFSGSTNNIEILNAAESVIAATASDVTATDTANVIAFTSTAGAVISATDTAAGFQIKDSGGTVKYKFMNTSYAIAAADQSTGADTFTSTAHGLTNDQPLVISNDIPTTSPAVSDGDTVYVVESDTNTFKIAREIGGDAVDITAAASVSTTFTAMEAVGASASGAVMEFSGGISLTSSNILIINSLSVTIDVFSRKAS